MQINHQQLTSHLNRSLKPAYLISGDETLLVNETIEAIQKKAKQAGFEEKQVFTVASSFDWSAFEATAQSLSLFSEKSILYMRNPSAKFDKTATQCLQRYLEDPPKDKILIIATNKLSPAAKKAKWFKAFSDQGVVIPIWPLNPQQLLSFIESRFKKYGVTAAPQCTRLLAELTQGNLLSTDQAIQKLKLYEPNQTITPKTLAQVVSDSSRFTVFDLSRFLLLGNTKQALHCLNVLKETGTETVLLLWIMLRETRILYQYHTTKQVKNEWPARQEQLKVAARRLPIKKLAGLLQELAQLDLMIKGLITGNIWSQFERLTIKLCQH